MNSKLESTAQRPLSAPSNIGLVGLSHLYGESIDLERTTQFWKKQGYAFQEFRLGVGSEKSEKFLTTPATHSTLRYFKTQGPGFEFLEHFPNRPRPHAFKPRTQVFFSGISTSELVDPDQNTIVIDPALTEPTSIVVHTDSEEKTSSFFRMLGLANASLSEDEKVLLETTDQTPVFQLKASLFPQMSARFIVKEHTSLPLPKIDQFGLSGLSFIVRSLDSIQNTFSLQAFQTFEDSMSEKRVAFTNEFGVMIEFLEIIRRK